MLHEQAVLVSAAPKLGASGSVVSISDVERHYKSSALANSSAQFKCADCGVPVHAVIPAHNRKGRKRSPSPYFSSSPKRHHGSCNRVPIQTASGGKTGSATPGRSVRGTPPSRWIDPGTRNTSGAGTGATSVSLAGGLNRAASNTHPGTGVSIASSSRVQEFARAWRHMSSITRRATMLKADWNPGSNYESAFADIRTDGPSESPITPARIYLATIASVRAIATGFSVTLNASHADGKVLLIWIQTPCKSKVGGRELFSALAAGARLRDAEVFALGFFQFNRANRRGRDWYSLAIAEPNCIWLDA